MTNFSLAYGTIDSEFGFTGTLMRHNRATSMVWRALRRLPGTPGHQGEVLDLASDKDIGTPPKPPAKVQRPKVQSKDRDMGSALRSAYQRTVEENVPDEMLDLLNKLS